MYKALIQDPDVNLGVLSNLKNVEAEGGSLEKETKTEMIFDEVTRPYKLTAKEQEILKFMVFDGGRYKKIAERNCIAPTTVRNHLNQVRKKMGAETVPSILSKVIVLLLEQMAHPDSQRKE